MSDDAFLIAALAAVILLGAWREYGDNRRDARLMTTLGAIGMLASTAVWLG